VLRSVSPRVGSSEPVVDEQPTNVAAEQGSVIRHQRRSELERRRGDHEIEVRLQTPSRSELRLDDAEPVGNRERHRNDLDLLQLLSNALPVVCASRRAFCAIDQLGHDDSCW
jgi:hypothetical protein